MANIFNAITTGIGGIATTADSSGSFAFAKDGSTVATISGTGVITASAISGLSTALTVAQGGTGATSLAANNVILGNNTSAVQTVAPGTSGNVLTSNGTTWTSAALPAGGVTSLNGQTGAITNTDLYAIGSYINGRPRNGTAYAANSTIAGSSLYSVTPASRYVAGSVFDSWSPGTATFAGDLVNTGTWRCMTAAIAPQGGYPGLWVRIS